MKPNWIVYIGCTYHGSYCLSFVLQRFKCHVWIQVVKFIFIDAYNHQIPMTGIIINWYISASKITFASMFWICIFVSPIKINKLHDFGMHMMAWNLSRNSLQVCRRWFPIRHQLVKWWKIISMKTTMKNMYVLAINNVKFF